ncbi:DNA alkylation repair protein [Candidatus Thorarchaeota archaeon]|nr:MAG: DNA alkylation repair protein [Candidatus Thorarchaeota archaeon]
MPTSAASSIMEALRGSTDPEQRERIAGYLKTSDLEFLGVKLPGIHSAVKKHIRGLEAQELEQTMLDLWSEDVYEFKRAAIDVMERYVKKGDPTIAIRVCSEWLDEGLDTWALLDPLASNCIGQLLIRDWDSVEGILGTWRTSENFWRRRATILPYLQLALKRNYKDEYAEPILDALLPHLADDEFFVAKAVGWVLRELSKRDPDVVREFIEKHESEMTPLAVREGSKKLK